MNKPLSSNPLCAFCGEPTDNLAGDPGKWSVRFCHPDGTGITRDHHERCVIDKIFRRPADETSAQLCGDKVLIGPAAGYKEHRCIKPKGHELHDWQPVNGEVAR